MKQVNTNGEQINIRTTVKTVVTPASFPVDPFPPSFPFVQPQVGARALPKAASDADVMPASNGTGLYWNTTDGQIRIWAGGPWGAQNWLALFGGGPTRLEPGADLSDLHGPGLYQAFSPVNAPPFTDTTNLYLADLDYMQFCISVLDSTHSLYFRSYALGAWGSWRVVSLT